MTTRFMEDSFQKRAMQECFHCRGRRGPAQGGEIEKKVREGSMGVAFSATMAFLTPFSHPVNTLTWGPGEYRFSDYARTGAALLVIAFLWGLFEIPRRFPFALH